MTKVYKSMTGHSSLSRNLSQVIIIRGVLLIVQKYMKMNTVKVKMILVLMRFVVVASVRTIIIF